MSSEISAGSETAVELRWTTSGVKWCRNRWKDAGGQQICDQELGEVMLGVCLANCVRYTRVLQASQLKLMVCLGGVSLQQLCMAASPDGSTDLLQPARERGAALVLAWRCPGLPWVSLAVSLPTLLRQMHVQPFSHPSGNAKDRAIPEGSIGEMHIE